MKKLILTIATALFFFESFGQQIDPAPAFPKQDYLKKSKKQKTTGWILLGGGAALVVIGAVIPKGEEVTPSPLGPFDPYGIYEVDENDGVKAVFYTIGSLSMLASIPFFISSGKNKRRAATLSLNNMRTPQIKNSSLVYRPMPAVSLKINL